MIGILEGDVAEIWQKTKEAAGITKIAFSAYYRGREVATAYQLGEVTIYDKPKELSDYGLTYVPQSFAYVETE